MKPAAKTHQRNASMETMKKVLAYAVRSNVGFMPGNPGKVNQDSYIVKTDLGGYANLNFFAVLDGHGYFGKEAS
jgi:serine/threonine protein phosphatase PrpC